MSTHVMVDLETLGNGNDAHILSIGAAKFDSNGILDRFHVGISLSSAEARNLTISADTVGWWLDLTSDAPEAWRAWRDLEKVTIWEALDGFSQWYGGAEIPLWGNGATFDNVILRSAYRACAIDFPVPFYMDRCYRTLKAMAPGVKLERKGTHHSAVDDAESQALHLIRICEALGIEL